jgi:hypothetical protein
VFRSNAEYNVFVHQLGGSTLRRTFERNNERAFVLVAFLNERQTALALFHFAF